LVQPRMILGEIPEELTSQMPSLVRRSIFLAFQNPETVSLRSEVQNLDKLAKVKRFSGL